ncbi:hypothetical protein B0H13DRAFT_2300445 [Mycena leptocephala]|nr:hypothetical protein B0H13DRAFT_2300445 [Mycena leptocephala]
MPDIEFAKHLVTLMTQSEEWRYCRDSLHNICQGDIIGRPVTSGQVIQRLKTEEVEKKIPPSIVSINALVAGTKSHKVDEVVPGRGTPSKRICDNSFCETPIGHTKDDCFSYGGGKASKYPANFGGRKDVHLAPEARIAARRKQVLEASGSRFPGMAEVTKDSEEEVNAVFERVEEGLAFMLELPNNDDDDEIAIDEEELHVTFFIGANYSTTTSNLTRR